MDPTETAPESTTATAPSTEIKQNKVTVKVKAVADAPVLKGKKFTVNPADTIAQFTATMQKMRKLLNIGPNDSLFFYIDSCFSPSPDTTFETLARCYSVRSTKEEVVELQYSITPAWG